MSYPSRQFNTGSLRPHRKAVVLHGHMVSHTCIIQWYHQSIVVRTANRHLARSFIQSIVVRTADRHTARSFIIPCRLKVHTLLESAFSAFFYQVAYPSSLKIVWRWNSHATTFFTLAHHLLNPLKHQLVQLCLQNPQVLLLTLASRVLRILAFLPIRQHTLQQPIAPPLDAPILYLHLVPSLGGTYPSDVEMRLSWSRGFQLGSLASKARHYLQTSTRPGHVTLTSTSPLTWCSNRLLRGGSLLTFNRTAWIWKECVLWTFAASKLICIKSPECLKVLISPPVSTSVLQSTFKCVFWSPCALVVLHATCSIQPGRCERRWIMGSQGHWSYLWRLNASLSIRASYCKPLRAWY